MKMKELQILREGGAATAKWETKRIHNAEIPATIKHFSKISGIPVRDLHSVGTTGKTPSSSDIDLAVDASKYDMEIVHNKIMGELGDEGTLNKASKVASYAVPIRGKDDREKVQVDLMYGGNPEWIKFAYHSEGAGSKYKGAIRSILLSAVAAAINKKGMDHMEFDGDDLTIRAGRTVELATGLQRTFQYRSKNKDGKGYGTKMNSIPVDEFKKKFPNIDVNGGTLTVDDPAEVVKILFGSGTKPAHVNSAEQLIQLIKKKFDKETQEKIFRIATVRAKSVAGTMKLPPELTPDDK